jgi:hypothetical protein
MFTSIPANEAIEVLYQRMIKDKFCYFGLLPNDIRDLLQVLLNNNYFRQGNFIYKQMTGLPMGSKLSGLLADVFMSHLEDMVLSSLPTPLYYRYVDDCLVIAQSKDEAFSILGLFNQLHPNLRFEIELPEDNGALSLLDFTIRICNGRVHISPYMKPIKSGIMMNGNTSLPSNVKSNAIINEWRRIKSKCDGVAQMKKEKTLFRTKLNKNEHLRVPRLDVMPKSDKASNSREPVFYMTVPFISDAANTLIRKAIKPLGVSVRLSHKSKQLKDFFQFPNQPSVPNNLCKLRNCPVKNNLCLRKLVVYKVTCIKCNQFYIGSTKNHFHLRMKEHENMKQSNLHQHKVTCQSIWAYEILSRGSSVAEMRLKEAILIQQHHPTINKKENLYSLSNVSLV